VVYTEYAEVVTVQPTFEVKDGTTSKV